MRVLVIGGTEFISVHFVPALARHGHEVAVPNRGRRPDRLSAGVRAVVADRDHAAFAQTFAWYLREGLDRRDVDFAADDRSLAGRA